MKKTLYLMRHGQTLFNVQNKIQGWCDSPLTELGKAQCRIAGEYFTRSGITFDHLYCSTSERCSDTLELCVGPGRPYTRLKGLKEWNFGVFEGKDQCLQPKPPYGDFYVPFGGESEQQLVQRMVSTLQGVMDKADHQVVLAVSHGGACANFIRHFAPYNEVQYQPGIPNCTIFRLEYENGIFSLKEIIRPDFSALG